MNIKHSLNIMCSRCGKMESVPNNLGVIDKVAERWGSCGSALYCPRCKATWHERNNKPMADKANTFTLIAEKFFVAYYNGEYGKEKADGES